MTLNERLLDFLDGTLGADDEAELLHTLSVSPEKRELLRQFMKGDALLARDRQALQVPYEAERALWAKLDTFMPIAEPAEDVLPIAMQPASAPAGSMFSRFATATAAAIALFIGLGAGYLAGNNQSSSASLITNRPATVTAAPTDQNAAQNTERVVIRNVYHDRYITSNTLAPVASPLLLHDLLDLPSLVSSSVNSKRAPSIHEDIGSNDPQISSVNIRGNGLVVLNHIGGDGGNKPVFIASMVTEDHKTILQRFEFAIDESFGRQFPNSIATNVSLPLLTNSSLSTFFQVLPNSNLVWLGGSYGTANVTRKNLFTRAGNQTDPLQEVLASDTVHAQTSYLAGYLQLRFPAFASADLTLTAGYGFATLGQMMMGEIGVHYDVAREVGVNLGIRLLRFSYDLSADKAAAIASGTGSLVVPAAVQATSPSFNTELTTGLYFHF